MYALNELGNMQVHEKCLIKIKNTKKNNAGVKNFLMEGGSLFWQYAKLL